MEKSDRAEKLGEKEVFSTRRFRVINARLKIRGKVVEKPYIRHNDCAEMLAVTGSGSILLIESYRPEFDDYSYELPAGTLKDGENPKRAAERELEEETGYAAKNVRYMFSGYPLLGYSSSRLHFFLVTGLRKKEQRLEDDESISVKEFRPEEVLAMMESGEIKDLSVTSAMHYYMLLRKGKTAKKAQHKESR